MNQLEKEHPSPQKTSSPTRVRVLGVVVGLGAYAFLTVKNIKDILLDHVIEQLNDSNQAVPVIN